jgi:acetyl esterase/lipase
LRNTPAHRSLLINEKVYAMSFLSIILQVFAVSVGILSLIMSIPLFIPFRWPAAVMWGIKLFASALSPVVIVVDLLVFLLGIAVSSVFMSLLGIAGVLIYLVHIISVTRPPAAASGFARAFGRHWKDTIRPAVRKHFLQTRIGPGLPTVGEPVLEQNVLFAQIPGTDRTLLCDIWQPPAGVRHSGLAIVYLHGSAFYILDKDYGTRPFFRHLASQGHVIMDVAYRLAPETDIRGMINDAMRAIAWIKENAARYRIDSNSVVVAGGSAGAQLALLAAYTADSPLFTPVDLLSKDVSVAAVVALYPSVDLKDLYFHTNQHLTTRSIPGQPKKAVPTKMPGWIIKAMGSDYHRLGFDKGFENVGVLAPLLGGHPDECPDRYALFSPVTHVHSGSPPTLLVQGEHDIMAPVQSTRRLYRRLLEENVPTVMHIIPQTDHAFDLVLPRISPSAHNAVYDVERFLALIAATRYKKEYLSSNPVGLSMGVA